MRVVGAGLGRTGTSSLKVALERLLDAPCYHMSEVFDHPEHVEPWHTAVRGGAVDWSQIFDGYSAAVDFPAAVFWEELAETYPDSIILLSMRDAESWWRSADRTILPNVRHRPDDDSPNRQAWWEMVRDLFASRFSSDLDDPIAVKAAFERHVAMVRERAPQDRLVEWHPSRGWEPLCDALGTPIPDEPFPHRNTAEEFVARRRTRLPGPD